MNNRVIEASPFGRTLATALVAAAMACDSAPRSEIAPPAPAPSIQASGAVTDSGVASAEPRPENGTEIAAATDAADPKRITAFGVPDCDNYVKQYLACVAGKVSGEQKDKLMEAFDANRRKWRALATMREGAVALGLACRAAAQKSREELTVDYGCDF